MDMQLRDTHPKIFDSGIGRISEKKFLVEVNNVLESIPKERFTEKLLNAISDWYAVYVGFCFALQEIFWGIATTILLSF